MNDIIQLDEISVTVTRKHVKNVHLSVHPPHGVVTLVAPIDTRLEVARDSLFDLCQRDIVLV